MNEAQFSQLKFPIGPFVVHDRIDEDTLKGYIDIIEKAPSQYRALTEKLTAKDLSKSYREGSWNVQQVVNHVADMQLLHYFRMKKALTESDYKEITLVNIDQWAATPDSLELQVSDGLAMMESITKRFVFLMRSLNEQQHAISYYHPVRKIMLNQKQAVSMTAWHVQHHLEHIKIALSN